MLDAPGTVRLQGSFQDDGLPNPPGVTTIHWTQKQGPAQVEFQDPQAWITEATFPAPGTYLLELTANDGAFTAQDTVTIQVAGPPQPPQIQSVQLIGGEQPVLRIRFTAPGARRCQIQHKVRLTDPEWKTVVELQIAPGAQTLQWSIPIDLQSPSGFYRIVIP